MKRLRLVCVSWVFLTIGYLSKHIEEKLPVLLEGPILEKITKSSVVIRVDSLEYGTDEATPDHYLIQYKEKKGCDFKNYSTPQLYSADLENKMFKIDSIVEEIRILLIANDRYNTANVPKITIGSLQQIAVETTSILLEWFTFNSGANYNVEYECRQKYCNMHAFGNATINVNKYTIEHLDPFSKCSIRLYDLTSKNQPGDIIKATTHKKDGTVFPTKFKFTNQSSMIIYFDDCNYFTETLTYFFELRCMSKWCKNETKIVLSENNKKYKKREIINSSVELLPFTEYKLTVNATLQNVTNSKHYSPQTTPPTRPKQVQNLSIECQDKTTVRIKWQLSYPLTGNISEYYITSETWNKTIKNTETVQCGPENSFICGEITGEKISKILVQVKNEDVAELGLASQIEIPNVAQAPENVTLKFVPPDKAILSWSHSFLKEFLIEVYEVDNKKFNNYISISDKCTGTFKHEIEFKNSNSEYILNIGGLNVQSENATSNVILASTSFSSNPLIQFCSKIKCTLSVPKPENSTNASNFSIEVKKKESDENVWTIPNVNFTQDDYVSLEIKDKHAISLRNETHIMYLRDENNNGFPLHLVKNKPTTLSSNILVPILIIIGVVIIIICAIYYCYKTYGPKPWKNYFSVRKLQEIDQQEEQNLQTSMIPLPA